MGRKIVLRVMNNNKDRFSWFRRRDPLETSKLITFYQWNFAGVRTQHIRNISLVGSSHDFVKPVETSSHCWH